MYSLGVASHVGSLVKDNLKKICFPGTPAYFALIYRNLDWIKSITFDELCLTNSYFKVHSNELIIFLILNLIAFAIALIAIAITLFKNQKFENKIELRKFGYNPTADFRFLKA